MASSGAKSRWGSFLQQAVAGVEARLDNILAEGDEAGKQPQQQTTTASEAPVAIQKANATATPGSITTSLKPSPSPTPTPTNRTNDRLQERLARAVARSTTPPTPRRSQDTAERPKSSAGSTLQEQNENVVQRTPSESESARIADHGCADESGTKDTVEEILRPASLIGDPVAEDVLRNGDASVAQAMLHVSDQEKAGAADIVEEQPSAQEEDTMQPGSSTTSGESEVTRLQSQLEQQLLQHQEEIHLYVERVDALEAKLRYLAREATDSARKAALAAPTGSLERKLGEKDQQISQLMEEGQNLASAEQKYRMTIKRLRAKTVEDEVDMKELRAKAVKLEAELKSSREKLGRADASSKAVDDLRKQMASVHKDLENTRLELSSRDSLVSDLKAQLKQATERATLAAAAANDGSREQDRRRIQDLEESVAALQVEKSLLTERYKGQIKELEEKSQRAAERAKAAELEAKGELQALEAKLEAMRANAEEVSTGVTGDAQAKLLRQIETLQSQYSTASENWRGIEATLIARAAELERERDESLTRESEMRRKAREASARARRVEEELEETLARLPSLTQDSMSQQSQIEALTKRATEAESALAAAQAEVERLKSAPAPEKAPRGGHHQSSWADEFSSAQIIRNHQNHHRPDSPLASLRLRNSGGEPLTLQALTGRLPRASASPGPPDDLGSAGRRSSTALHSLRSPLPGHPHGGAGVLDLASPPPPETPFSFASLGGGGDADDPLDGIMVETPSSPPRRGSQAGGAGGGAGGTGTGTGTINNGTAPGDVLSVSTIGAGPSVQLVERMSAAIRRLESEKVATRDELVRISSQRDDARAEIVSLMRDVEAGRAAVSRVAELEAEVASINARYQTTLEMLGEKSELVEELRADVDDVKTMYRELVERTVK